MMRVRIGFRGATDDLVITAADVHADDGQEGWVRIYTGIGDGARKLVAMAPINHVAFLTIEDPAPATDIAPAPGARGGNAARI